MQDLINKINGVIKVKFPDYTEQEIEEMMSDYAEIAFKEFVGKVLSELPNENVKEEFKKLFGDRKIDEAIALAFKNDVDAAKIFEDIGKSIVMEILE